ncbi:hypothetical protein [Nocardia transvalensis]|uniref:hypothetical protein n=1 Tax=Nocardia transvalensis TaxID=37333 RepID=UPI0018953F1B|nr:hypothetical protein [Nocardia transvalensis]MBF6328138.1 hypothetical protein [Nocardia transvalensis]
MLPALPLRDRAVALSGVFFGAPVCAEYLQSYLGINILEMLAALLFFGPLYGGAALLVRELAVRTGRGWRGILLLSAAFGVAMPGLVDLSLFEANRDDVDYWNELRLPTLVEPLGISVFPSIAWVSGHVLMSVGAPLALLNGLAPRHRNRPLLGRVGIVVVAALCLSTMILVHSQARGTAAPTTTQTAVVLAIIAIVIVLAATPFGRPVANPGMTQPVPKWLVLSLGITGMLIYDFTPPTWFGVGAAVAVLAAAAGALHRLPRHRDWNDHDIATLACGALVGRTLTGFFAPNPAGVSALTKYSSNALLLLLVLGLSWAVLVRSDS